MLPVLHAQLLIIFREYVVAAHTIARLLKTKQRQRGKQGYAHKGTNLGTHNDGRV